MSDTDLADVVAYLRAQPAVSNEVPKSRYSMPLPPSEAPPVGRIEKPKPSDTLRYGKYLADVGHCMECHTPRGGDGQLVKAGWGAGGQVFKGPWGTSVSRNLTSHETGLKHWTDAQIAAAVRTDKDRQGRPYKPPMAFGHYRSINDEDMAALIAYLRSLPGQPAAGSR